MYLKPHEGSGNKISLNYKKLFALKSILTCTILNRNFLENEIKSKFQRQYLVNPPTNTLVSFCTRHQFGHVVSNRRRCYENSQYNLVYI